MKERRLRLDELITYQGGIFGLLRNVGIRWPIDLTPKLVRGHSLLTVNEDVMKRRWFRFRLRTLLMLPVLVGVRIPLALS